MINIKEIDNHKCLKCDKVYPTMIKIGVFIMCNSCTVNEFGIVTELSPKDSRYLKWLNFYKNKYDE